MALSVDRINGLTGDLAIKTPVRVATTANITLSGLQTIDGVALAAGDRVLVKNQTSAADNGIWVANTSAWSRALDFDGAYDVVQGTMVIINSGTVNGGSAFKLDTTSPVIGTSSLTFSVANDFALRGDLAAATGSSLVGFLQAGTGAVARTVQGKNRDDICVLDYIPVALHADILAGTSSTDVGAYFAAARTAAAGRKVKAPAGKYTINTAVTSTEDLVIDGDGPETILDFTGAVTGGGYGLEAIGTLTQIQGLNADVSAGATSITFSSAPSLSVGDVFVIYNPTDSSWHSSRTNYRAGEWCEVEAVSGSTVTLKNQLYDSYVAANVDVYKVSASPVVRISNLRVVGTTVEGLINASRCIRPVIENVVGDHANNSVINFDRCFKPTVINPEVKNVGDGGDDYGIAFGNSQHGRVFGGAAYARRHAITTGGNAEIGCVPCRDIRVIETVIKNDITSGVEAADFHGNTEDSSYENCTIYGGANLQGKDNFYRNCTITNRQDGVVIHYAEVKGGRLGAINCDFKTSVDPSATNRGIINVGGNETSVGAFTTLPLTVVVNNCRLNGQNLSSITSFVLFRNRGATAKINFDIDGLSANVNAMNGVLNTRNISGTAASDYIIVDRISGFPSGTNLHNCAIDNAYRDFPHRLQKQSGKVVVSAASGINLVLGATTTYKYPYPREPVGLATVGQTTPRDINGNRVIIGGIQRLRSNDIIPMAFTGDAVNWTSTFSATINWEVKIDEV